MGFLNGTITFVYIGLGWHQLWNPDRRVEDLRKRWAKGSKTYGCLLYTSDAADE